MDKWGATANGADFVVRDSSQQEKKARVQDDSPDDGCLSLGLAPALRPTTVRSHKKQEETLQGPNQNRQRSVRVLAAVLSSSTSSLSPNKQP